MGSAPGSQGRSVNGNSRPGGWVWDEDAGHSYWSKWAYQPTTIVRKYTSWRTAWAKAWNVRRLTPVQARGCRVYVLQSQRGYAAVPVQRQARSRCTLWLLSCVLKAVVGWCAVLGP